MNKEQMLQELGLTSDEFNDLLQKYASFANSLDPAQKAVVENSIPKLHEAAASFGPDVTPGDLESLFLGVTDVQPTICFLFIKRHHPNP
jgi:hypothetical protein